MSEVSTNMVCDLCLAEYEEERYKEDRAIKRAFNFAGLGEITFKLAIKVDNRNCDLCPKCEQAISSTLDSRWDARESE